MSGVKACTAIVLKNKYGQYLLTQRGELCATNKGKWEFPGGKMDVTDATVQDCAIRELFEETGLIPDEISKDYQLHRGDSPSWLCFYFFCWVFKNQQITLEEGKTVDYRWVNKDEMLSFDLTQECRDFCTNHLEK